MLTMAYLGELRQAAAAEIVRQSAQHIAERRRRRFNTNYPNPDDGTSIGDEKLRRDMEALEVAVRLRGAAESYIDGVRAISPDASQKVIARVSRLARALGASE